jgi:hypothetical protein
MRRFLELSTGSIRFHHISTQNKLLIYTIIFHNWHNLSIVPLLLSGRIGLVTAATGGRALAACIEETGITARGSYDSETELPCDARATGAGAVDLIRLSND